MKANVFGGAVATRSNREKLWWAVQTCGVATATTSQATSTSLLRFDVFELDTYAVDLRKRGVKVRLQGKPLLVLAALLERPGELVTREELREQIWPADTFVNFDHSLHHAIARVRDALGDSTEKPRYIETLPRAGDESMLARSHTTIDLRLTGGGPGP